MSSTDRTKKQKKSTSGCSCCGGTRNKKAPDSNDDVADPRPTSDNKENNDDDASHIASIKNRSNSGSMYLEVEGSKSKSKKKSKGKKENKRSKNAKQEENSSLVSKPPQKSKGGCKKCCMKFTAFLFSHIGLSSLVVGYSIMGGFLFQWLESASEVQVRSDMKGVRDKHVRQLWDVTTRFNVLYEENWTIDANSVMIAFQDQVYLAVKEKGWDGKEEESTGTQWSFPGSLLYSITVITTIGYGHIAPKTDMGRLATIFYALVGIPLTLLFLANIGALFGNCFRFMYKHLCIALVWLCCPNHFQQNKSSPKTPNKKNGKGGVQREPSPIPKIQLDDTTEKEPTIFNEKDTLQTLQWKATSNSALDAEEGYCTVDFPGGSSGDDENHAHQDYKETLVQVKSEKKRKKTLKEEVRVPIFVSLLIIASYIFGGACLFSVWEKDWDYLIGSYFCFITLSTVGFGDYVFGTGEWNDNGKLIICALYLVFGLSIIAMTFDLMQEEVRAKFRWLGTKLGLIHEGESS